MGTTAITTTSITMETMNNSARSAPRKRPTGAAAGQAKGRRPHRKDTGMTKRDSIAMCIKNLLRRKFRTFLTVSGVIIGTCAITVMVSLGIGMQKTLEETLAQLGDLTIITIYNYGTQTQEPLDDAMLDKFKALDNVVAVTPVYSTYLSGNYGNFTLGNGKWSFSGQVSGVDFDALRTMGYSFDEGDFPDAEGGYEGKFVLAADSKYDFSDKRGNYFQQTTKADGSPCDPPVDVMNDRKLTLTVNKSDSSNNKKAPSYKMTCTGILSSDYEKNPYPYGVFMDIKYLKKLESEYNKLNGVKVDKNKKESYEQVVVKVASMNDVEAVEEYITSLGFNTNSMESVRKPIQEQANQQQMILGSLGAISLFVAALSITNTMVMSVYERTREIGVMKVLGCSLSDIRGVFLMEAGTIGFSGGVVGVIISYIISFIINHYSSGGGGDSYTIGMTSIGGSSIIPWWLAVGAVLFATFVGLISGFSPANRAVKISALSAIKNDG